jgi:uncharacterized protein YukE
MALTKMDKDYITQTIKTEIDPIDSKIQQLWRVIKGDNGEGVQTELKLLQKSVTDLTQSLENFITQTNKHRDSLQFCQLDNIPKVQQALETSSRIDKRVSEFIQDMKEQRRLDKEEQKEREKDFGSWVWFRDKRIEPLWVAISLYIVVELVKLFLVY